MQGQTARWPGGSQSLPPPTGWLFLLSQHNPIPADCWRGLHVGPRSLRREAVREMDRDSVHLASSQKGRNRGARMTQTHEGQPHRDTANSSSRWESKVPSMSASQAPPPASNPGGGLDPLPATWGSYLNTSTAKQKGLQSPQPRRAPGQTSPIHPECFTWQTLPMHPRVLSPGPSVVVPRIAQPSG